MDFKDLIIHTRTIPARSGEYADFPEGLHPDIREFLEDTGIHRLYAHQAEMFLKAQQGENVVITTSTASGKTLGFLLPVLQQVLKEPLSRAVFLYPTKALAADQLRALAPALSFFGPGRLGAGVYDGDTPASERSRIRKNANLILTNPDMLNSAFLPNHSSYGFDFIFSNLKYVVVDELHSYRGAFGSHVANVLRRLERICRYYGSKPQFLCSSATIANPLELAGRICGRPFALVEKDGAPAPEKTYRILQPPVIRGKDGREYGQVSASSVAAELIPELAEAGRHFIAFGRSRRNVEVILKEARDRMEGAGAAARIAGYRGGYTAGERREIQRRMAEGELLGLVSTNALELGIDIGSLDTTVLVGYPGTRASFWQQTGRAGRSVQTGRAGRSAGPGRAGCAAQAGSEGRLAQTGRVDRLAQTNHTGRLAGTKEGASRQESGACINYLILENQPFDQYIAISPDWLFDRESENAIVDENNLLIQLSHIRAAAAELPLTLDDAALFPDLGEVIPVLLSEKELKSLGGRFAWSGPAFPAGDYSLRNMDKIRFLLQREADGRIITEMDESQAYHELYPGAVYMHEGALYEVRSLDQKSHTARAVPFAGNYYTVPLGSHETRILHTASETAWERTVVRFGDINVEEAVTMYKKLQFHDHHNLGYFPLEAPLEKAYDTESTWLEVPQNVVRAYRRLLQRSPSGELVRNNHFEGMAAAIKSAAMMVTMASREDMDVIVSNNALVPDEREEQAVFLFIYDKYVGGLGYSEKIFDRIPQILEHAIRLVAGCRCEDGCPACVGDYTLDKGMVLWGLQNLLKESAAPGAVKTVYEPVRPESRKAFAFCRLPECWESFCACAERSGEAGGTFFGTAEKVETEGSRLILNVKGSFLYRWASETENLAKLEKILRRFADCPADMRLEIRGLKNEEEEAKRAKLQRRMESTSRTPGE